MSQVYGGFVLHQII